LSSLTGLLALDLVVMVRCLAVVVVVAGFVFRV